MNITDTHAVPSNPREFLADNRFYNINPKKSAEEDLIFGLLNSTLTFLCAEIWGRQFAGKGIDSIDIKVYEVAQLPFLKPRAIKKEVASRIIGAIRQIAQRPILPVLEEIDQPDRKALDDAVLEAIGFNDEKERKEVLQALYDAVCQRVQSRFERARSTHHPGEKTQRPSPEAIAEELYKELSPDLIGKFPDDFVPSRVETKELLLPEGATDFERLTFNRLRIGDKVIDFDNPDEAEFVFFSLQGGKTSAIRIPSDKQVLAEIVSRYREHLAKLFEAIEQLASSRTRDRKLKERIKDSLKQRLGVSIDLTSRLL